MQFKLIKKVPVVEAAYSYVYYLDQPPHFPIVDVVEDCGFSGRPWTASVRHLPCEFMGYPFEILCGDAKDNPEFVPPEGVIGYDFFANFTLVVDRFGGKLTFVKKLTERNDEMSMERKARSVNSEKEVAA